MTPISIQENQNINEENLFESIENISERLFTGDRDTLSDEMRTYMNNIRSTNVDMKLHMVIHRILNYKKINNETLIYINGLSFEERLSVLYIYNKMMDSYMELLESNNSSSHENSVENSVENIYSNQVKNQIYSTYEETPPLSTPDG